MKSPDFDYFRANTLQEALTCLQAHGSNAQLLAGGQSLLAMLNLRLASPHILIDISRIPGLSSIERHGSVLRIGALVTHRQLLDSAEVAASVPLLAQAVPYVAHLAIRNAGTIGGSLALADPAAEYPSVALALQATLIAPPPCVASVESPPRIISRACTKRPWQKMKFSRLLNSRWRHPSSASAFRSWHAAAATTPWWAWPVPSPGRRGVSATRASLSWRWAMVRCWPRMP